MSVKIAIVCEDHTHDQYTVKPIVEKLLSHLGKPRARISVVTSPRLQGITTVRARACEILKRYGGVVDLIAFMVDADGEDGEGGRPNRAATLAAVIAACDNNYATKAVVVAAIQETEVWALWGVRGEISDDWGSVRAHRDPKEAYFEPLQTHADLQTPGEGRARMIERALAPGWNSIEQGCPELGPFARDVRAKLGL